MSRRHLVSIHYDSVDSFLDPFLDGFVWICNYVLGISGEQKQFGIS